MSGPDTPSHPACGIIGWPFAAVPSVSARPDRLPDGRPWPRILVLTPPGEHAPETTASIVQQDYPELHHREGGRESLPGIAQDGSAHGVLFLQAGDMLAPGALTALALEAALTGAQAVAGLRVLYTDRVLGLDAPSLEDATDGACDGVLWTGNALEDTARRHPGRFYPKITR